MDFLPSYKAETVSSPEGVVHLWRPARGVLVTQARGRMFEQAARIMDAYMRRVVAEDGKLVGFNDWEALSDYDSKARARLVDVAEEISRAIEGSHFLLGSRLVALGVQAVGVLMHGLTVHQTRRSFEDALRATLHARGVRIG